MIYNLHELSKIYGLTVRFFQKKYNEYKNEQKRTRTNKNEQKRIRKDGRTALKHTDLKRFIEFCDLDISKLKNEQKRTETNENEQDSDHIVKFLKQQITELNNRNAEQNKIIAMTQKNLNDLIQDHKKLKYDNLKKAELINKWDEEQENLKKLNKLIDKVMGDKREKDARESIQFGYELLKEKKKQK